MTNKKKSIFTNPGIIMVIIMSAIAIFMFAWFPNNTGWYGIPMINWLMIIVYFIWLLQSIVFMFWAERVEKRDE